MGDSQRASLLFLLVLLAVAGLTTNARASYGEATLYRFLGFPDGASPYGNLITDGAGNLYGTTRDGGAFGCGSVFELVRGSSGWTELLLYSFSGGTDGSQPLGGLVFDQAGSLYGTTFGGGNSSACGSGPGSGCGVIFKLDASKGWAESAIYSFSGGADGAFPSATLIFDTEGNLYGTAGGGGSASCTGVLPNGCGVLFKLIPENGGWQQQVLHTFLGGKDGSYPTSGVISDSLGNLYGTTATGGTNFSGVIYALLAGSGSSRYRILHAFTGGKGGGNFSVGAPLVLDSAGNLYGTTQMGGNLNGCGGSGCGIVFELSPQSNGGWSGRLVHAFGQAPDGAYPEAGLTVDAAGNLYGTTTGGGLRGIGNIFAEVPTSTGFKEYILYQFTNENLGCNPNTSLVLDTAGNLYGTTSFCGTAAYGVVYELTP
jgi:uncharacterized repeat protein (TIGR03803 family)